MIPCLVWTHDSVPTILAIVEKKNSAESAERCLARSPPFIQAEHTAGSPFTLTAHKASTTPSHADTVLQILISRK